MMSVMINKLNETLLAFKFFFFIFKSFRIQMKILFFTSKDSKYKTKCI